MFKEVTTTNPQSILFTFHMAELFDKVSANSIYASKNIRSQDGKSLIDNYAITVDEEDFVKMHLYDAANNLFGLFVKMTRAITDSFYFDKAKEDPSNAPKTSQQLGWSIKRELKSDNTPAYNTNRLPLISANCQDYMVNYVLAKWAEVNKQGDEIAIREKAKGDAERKLIDNLFEIRKPAYNKSYSA